ncbi:FAD-dependent oxidoreductase [Vreelandella malpeensis]|uniref:FAD-dependent oxidoreductase n=1 Tax=Vreelandella malpeensis TaxID=1172368 RepID=A0ABS8DR06_9GAMM|nr:FAD-dependent oxidoreductase [Halomonas malpeensis]MCB8888290.1 FAD-dependent oxidoreductase [Halomonas malpeensis]
MDALGRKAVKAAASITFTFEGEHIKALEGQSLASALVGAGHLSQREGRQGGLHGHYCGMGACFECLVNVDGHHGVRACMTPAQQGQTVTRHPYKSPLTHTPSHATPKSSHEIVTTDVLVIGGGPAGLQAALSARQAGADVLLVDERPSLGGQYYKQLSQAYATRDGKAPDKQMQAGRELIQAVKEAKVRSWHDTLVWGAFRERPEQLRIGVEQAGEAKIIEPRAVVVATGATERSYPVPGWTLPGVMTTGGLQTLLRSYRTAPPGPVLVAGNGPLNLQVAAELVAAGVEVAGVVESARLTSLTALARTGQASRHAPGLISAGLGYLLTLKRARVPIFDGQAVAAIEGDDAVQSVVLAPVTASGELGEARRRLHVKAVGLGYGFQPQAEIGRLLGVEHAYAPATASAVNVLSADRRADGSCNIDGIFIAGEAGGFGGAQLALAQGALAGAAAAKYCGHEVSDSGASWRERQRTHQHFQTALWRAFESPLKPLAGLTDDTVVCRCEGITAGEIRSGYEAGSDVASVKRQTRAGMGRCQGRYCASTVSRLIASDKSDGSQFDLPAPQNPIKPITIGALAIEKGEWAGHRRVDMPRSPSRQTPGAARSVNDAEVLVIGAGVAGSATARALAQRGVDVAVLDRGLPNGQASGGNAGSLHVQLLSFDFGAKAESGGGPAASTLPLQQASASLWEQLASELGCDIEFKRSGGLMVAENEVQMRFLERKAALERSLGIDTQIVGRSDVERKVPTVSEAVVGGAWCAEEGKINPLLATPALVRAAKQAGARFYTGDAVCSIERVDGQWQVGTRSGRLYRAPRIVNAAGAWAGEIGRLAGIDVPVHAAPLQMIVTEAAEPVVDVLLAHADRHLTLKQAANGNVIIGGGWPAGLSIPFGYQRPLLDSIEGNLWVAQHVLPALNRLRVIRSWAAVNINIDGAPILGEAPGLPGFFNAVTSNGYTLGPLVGQITADLLTRGHGDWDLTPFSLTRFEGLRLS